MNSPGHSRAQPRRPTVALRSRLSGSNRSTERRPSRKLPSGVVDGNFLEGRRSVDRFEPDNRERSATVGRLGCARECPGEFIRQLAARRKITDPFPQTTSKIAEVMGQFPASVRLDYLEPRILEPRIKPSQPRRKQSGAAQFAAILMAQA